VQRLILVIVLVVLVAVLASLPTSAVSDNSPSLADSNVPDSEIAASQTGATNSSASATITITMTGVMDE
jgi:hypothetical protein